MLAEFALEPRLLHNWDRFQRLVSLFGVAQGRLISRFPKKWQQMVLDAVTCGPVEKAKIEEALRRLLKDRLFPRYHEWRVDIAWLDNAIAEHGKRPFHAILCAGGLPGNDDVVDASDLDVTALPVKMHAGPPQLVTRSAQDLAAATRLLFQFSRKIVLMDRNFAPDKARYREPLAEMLRFCLNEFARPRQVEVELHFGHRVLENAADFRASCSAHLQDMIPEGMILNVVRWNHDDLHNRVIITDRGGIQLGEGLDEPNPMSTRTDDLLTLLAPVTVAELMERYCGVLGKAKQQMQHRIQGRKKITS
jgi:hypothetical protein